MGRGRGLGVKVSSLAPVGPSIGGLRVNVEAEEDEEGADDWVGFAGEAGGSFEDLAGGMEVAWRRVVLGWTCLRQPWQTQVRGRIESKRRS